MLRVKPATRERLSRLAPLLAITACKRVSHDVLINHLLDRYEDDLRHQAEQAIAVPSGKHTNGGNVERGN